MRVGTAIIPKAAWRSHGDWCQARPRIWKSMDGGDRPQAHKETKCEGTSHGKTVQRGNPRLLLGNGAALLWQRAVRLLAHKVERTRTSTQEQAEHERRRFSITLSEKTADAFEWPKTMTDAHTDSEFIRSALRVHHVLLQRSLAGHTFFVRSSDGSGELTRLDLFVASPGLLSLNPPLRRLAGTGLSLP
ncbi:hypothetical protein GGD63_006274 [Bradyrhizobium sp. cir1]|nr:hypothetical protein [Bradyrhizobium sp. cir1]